jgi:hypothetical protein
LQKNKKKYPVLDSKIYDECVQYKTLTRVFDIDKHSTLREKCVLPTSTCKTDMNESEFKKSKSDEKLHHEIIRTTLKMSHLI